MTTDTKPLDLTKFGDMEATLQTELDRYKADAERYRWLADSTQWLCELNQFSGPSHRQYVWHRQICSSIHNENGGLDAAIDAAIADAARTSNQSQTAEVQGRSDESQR